MGTRFHPLTLVIPKCLIPVAGKPAVRWIIEDIMAQGFHDIVLLINRQDEPLFRYEFRDLDLQFSVSEEPCGSAGEIFTARKFVQDTFIVHYGDDLTKVPYKEMVEFHRKKGADATLAVTKKVPLEVGIISLNHEGRVVSFAEKPFLGKNAWAAVSVFEPLVLKYCAPGKDLASEVVPQMMADGCKVYGYDTDSLWVDVGNIGHWRMANKLIKEGKLLSAIP